MTLIQDITAREILAADGTPTLEAEVSLACGALGRASIPLGVADELRDTDDPRFSHAGVKRALDEIRDRICLVLRGLDALDQIGVDQELNNLSRLSGNSRLVTSMATAQAAALALEIPLYRHLGGTAARRLPMPLPSLCDAPLPAELPFRDLLLAPVRPNWPYHEALRATAETSRAFRTLTAATPPATALECLDAARAAVEQAGYSPDNDLQAAPVASHAPKAVDALAKLYADAPFAFAELPADTTLPAKPLPFPCALTAIPKSDETPARLYRCLTPAHYHTVTECLEAARTARGNANTLILQNDTTTTDDTFAADLAIAVHAQFLQAGPLSRLDAVAQYNHLLRLE